MLASAGTAITLSLTTERAGPVAAGARLYVSDIDSIDRLVEEIRLEALELGLSIVTTDARRHTFELGVSHQVAEIAFNLLIGVGGSAAYDAVRLLVGSVTRRVAARELPGGNRDQSGPLEDEAAEMLGLHRDELEIVRRHEQTQEILEVALRTGERWQVARTTSTEIHVRRMD